MRLVFKWEKQKQWWHTRDFEGFTWAFIESVRGFMENSPEYLKFKAHYNPHQVTLLKLEDLLTRANKGGKYYKHF